MEGLNAIIEQLDASESRREPASQGCRFEANAEGQQEDRTADCGRERSATAGGNQMRQNPGLDWTGAGRQLSNWRHPPR